MVTKCNQLKLEATDGKKYLTDVADPETILRVIQSIPSPKAEPIKLWLAKVGYERNLKNQRDKLETTLITPGQQIIPSHLSPLKHRPIS